MKRSILAAVTAVATLVAPAAANAQEQGGFALNQFQPSPAGDMFFGVPSPYASGHLTPRGYLGFDYAHEPVREASTDTAVVTSLDRLPHWIEPGPETFIQVARTVPGSVGRPSSVMDPTNTTSDPAGTDERSGPASTTGAWLVDPTDGAGEDGSSAAVPESGSVPVGDFGTAGAPPRTPKRAANSALDFGKFSRSYRAWFTLKYE